VWEVGVFLTVASAVILAAGILDAYHGRGPLGVHGR